MYRSQLIQSLIDRIAIMEVTQPVNGAELRQLYVLRAYLKFHKEF